MPAGTGRWETIGAAEASSYSREGGTIVPGPCRPHLADGTALGVMGAGGAGGEQGILTGGVWTEVLKRLQVRRSGGSGTRVFASALTGCGSGS